MPSELSKEIANDYFANLNPIAMKISIDINETKSSYEHIWNQLSTTEQIEIINDTLIKPEIALRYFDNFSTSSSCSVSLSNDDYTTDEGKIKTCDKLSTKKIYNYDGKNLSSYSAQKTGLKKIHDDTIGIIRDEHSGPFSYKTKSQINLKLFTDSISNKIENTTSIDIQQLQKFQKLNNELAKNLSNKTKGLKHVITSIGQNNELNKYDKIDGKYERFYNDETLGGALDSKEAFQTNDTHGEQDDKTSFLSKFICKNNLIFNTNTNLITKSNQIGQNDEEDEELKLMKNISYSGLTSSSSIPSEEEEDKQIYEDSKLLLENDELRKGFDFLNNW